MTPARAEGWERGWFVCIDNAASRSYACERCEGLPDSCRLLGIRPCSGSSVAGALIALEDHEVPALEKRERSYRLREIPVQGADGTSGWLALVAVPRQEYLCTADSAAPIPVVYEAAFQAAMRELAGEMHPEPAALAASGAAARRAHLHYVRGDGIARGRCTCAPGPPTGYFGV
jgi:hypothetical protein